MVAGKNVPLLTGQRYVWLRGQELPPGTPDDANVLRRLDLLPGTTMATVRQTVNYLVRRHEGLRTTYHLPPAGPPTAIVQPPAAVPLLTVSVEADGTPMPGPVVAELVGRPFDPETELPLRACVLTSGGVPTQLLLVFGHLAVDAWALETLETELRALADAHAGGRPTALRPVRHQPSDLARHEASPAGRAARARSSAYWRERVPRLPDDAFAAVRRVAGPVGAPIATGAALTSPALLGATRQLAERWQVWPAVVHLAAYAQVLLTATGASALAHLFFSGNRAASACPDALTCSFTPLPLAVSAADDPGTAELARRCAADFAAAEAHPDLPYDELLDLLAAESVCRGRPVRLAGQVNVLGHAGTPTRARRTVVVSQPPPAAWVALGEDTMLRVDLQPDAVTLVLYARTTVLPPEAVPAVLRGYEALLLAAAAGADPRRSDLVDWGVPCLPTTPTVLPPTGGVAADEEGGPGPAAPGDRVTALCAAVAAAHGRPEADPRLDFSANGGRALLIPRVRGRLTAAGLTGLRAADLLDGRPLAAVAAGLSALPADGEGRTQAR